MKKYTFLLSALCCSLTHTMDFQPEGKLIKRHSESYECLLDALQPFNVGEAKPITPDDTIEKRSQSDNLLTEASYLRLCGISEKKISVPKREGSPRKRKKANKNDGTNQVGYEDETEQEANFSPRQLLRNKLARGLSDPKKFIKAN